MITISLDDTRFARAGLSCETEEGSSTVIVRRDDEGRKIVARGHWDGAQMILFPLRSAAQRDLLRLLENEI